MKINPNFRDPVTLKALLETAFSDYDPNRTDLTGKPQIRSVVSGAVLEVEFQVRDKPYVFYYYYAEENASGYLQKPDEQCGSDDDPDWECCTPHIGWAFIAFIAAIKEGLL